MKKLIEFLKKHPRVVGLVFAFVGFYGIAINNPYLTFFGGSLWGLLLNEAHNRKTIEDLNDKIGVLERYIDRREL